MSYDKSFIEVQFPVSKVSKECYKERKAGSSQLLTGFGKWWGRKPLFIVRASLLGLLFPSTQDPKKDREIFLKILTMDEEGLWNRKNKSISSKDIFNLLTPEERNLYFETISADKPTFKKGLKKEEKANLQKIAFNRLSYDEKLKYCLRPEQVENLDQQSWSQVNAYLGTTANSFQELIKQLGERKFGHTPSVGDCFSGGGSIPFEAARLGSNVNASDLNPIATLLTWSVLNLTEGNKEEIQNLKKFQQTVYENVDKQITRWGIEHNEQGWRAVAYLYCTESNCPECGYRVPFLPSTIIGTRTRTVVKLIKNDELKAFDFEVIENASDDLYEEASEWSTVADYSVKCPNCHTTTPIPSIRRDMDDGVERPYRYNTPNSLRKWEQLDFVNRESDILSERLYCIKYEETTYDNDGNPRTIMHYVAPSEKDVERENKVIALLAERIEEWQKQGYIPSDLIEAGWNTNQPIYEKGWTYWHHLFNPRQLLIKGLLMENSVKYAKTDKELIVTLLGINKCANWNSKLSMWSNDDTHNSRMTFSNQALNTLAHYCCRAYKPLYEIWNISIEGVPAYSQRKVQLEDARKISWNSDIWITDPPYADAVNYHELSEFFLAWNRKLINKVFPHWYVDSKRILAVQGTGSQFNESMVEVYTKLRNNMPDNGLQLVMFTHQDVTVWAELSMILWSAGLQVTAAWNIATETESGGLKEGNYVKGTVLLVLRKQTSEETAYLDELYPDIEAEVKYQIDSMREIDDQDDPNFSDPDYLLAAYAASLKILTSYKRIEGIDVQYELSKARNANEDSPIVKIINEAVKIAYDYLIPSGFDKYIWKTLTPEERFYLKGLELEKHNIYQISGYQELARGFGVHEYKDFLASTKANSARLKTASEFGTRGLGDSSKFGSTLLRNILVAIHIAQKEEDSVKGRNWLKTELVNYWNMRSSIVEILKYIAPIGFIENMGHWQKDAHMASILKELVENDGV
ncbi:DUF1156 domain-containing protein [Paenibacillus sediminis]|uniref:Adenine-specific DNA methylase n=1 Tax=Paenibacillus sediminis TaxID=664909 RepID=A0ABS4H6R8_9BACL|nr:anti-phage-associated DUF1156 domain-containing protein [Paenibacillus sediminis]MBP1938220.1 adenine-specific DNA methylase [Paenibacillus sediminis]